MLEIETIELRNVSHSYGDGSNAVSKLDVKVKAGELICIIGPSGCGKSTILKILAGQLKPDRGEIFYNGQSLYENLKEIRPHICYAPEEEYFKENFIGASVHSNKHNALEDARVIRDVYLKLEAEHAKRYVR